MLETNDKIVGCIYETTDYGKFKDIKGNRVLTEKNIKNLTVEIEADGQQDPILITPNGYLYDGQNRLEACRRLNIPVKWSYTNKEMTVEDVQNFNKTQNHWKERDFLESYRTNGSKPAERVLYLMDTYKVGKKLIMIAAGKDSNTLSPSNTGRKAYKSISKKNPMDDRLFSEKDMEMAEYRLSWTFKILDILKKNRNVKHSPKLLEILVSIDKSEGFERERFEKIAETDGNEIPLIGFSNQQILKKIAYLYNHKRRKNLMDFTFRSNGTINKIVCTATDNRWTQVA